MKLQIQPDTLFRQASVYGGLLPHVWSFMLAARARGLGACWTTLHLRHADEVAEVLGLPENFTQAVMLTVGYYKGSGFGRATRRPAAEAIHWDHW